MAEDQKYSLVLQVEEKDAVYADKAAWSAVIITGVLIIIGIALFMVANRKYFFTSLDHQLDLSGDTLVTLSATREEGDYRSVQDKVIHIFRRDGQDWDLEHEIALADFLSVSENPRWDSMSFAIDLDGDTLALAIENNLPRDDRWSRNGDDHHRVYIFRRDDTTWELERKISKSSPIEGF